MGFGYLIYGFLMMIGLLVPTDLTFGTGIDAFPDLAGYLFFFTALCRLSAYADGFRQGKRWMAILLPVGAVQFVAGGLSLWPLCVPVASLLLSVCDALAATLCPIAFFYLFTGLYTLSLEVELPGLAKSARRAAAFGFVNYGAQLLLAILVASTLPIAQSGAMQIFRIFKQLLGIVYVIYCEVVSFRAYMYICYEGDENPRPGENPIAAFMNRLFHKNRS